MAIIDISLLNFRNHNQLEFKQLGEEIFIIGNNGIGKTNLLEAVSLLAPGKGFRKNKLGEMLSYTANDQPGIALSSKNWYLRFKIVDEFSDGIEVVVWYEENGNREKKRVKIDGREVKSQQEILEKLRVVWLTPIIYNLFHYASEQRRSFLDRMVYNFIPEHADKLSKYKRIMRERAALLKSGGGYDFLWMTKLEEQMGYYAQDIIHYRKETIDKINLFIAKSKWPQKPRLQLVDKHFYVSDDFDLQQYLRLTKDNRTKEEMVGRTLYGPHLDDIEIIYQEKGLNSHHCSTGEQKNLITKIVLAQLYLLSEQMQGTPIVLILDDVFAHIDSANKHMILDAIRDIPNVQKWVSGTHNDLEGIKKEKGVILDLNQQ